MKPGKSGFIANGGPHTVSAEATPTRSLVSDGGIFLKLCPEWEVL